MTEESPPEDAPQSPELTVDAGADAPTPEVGATPEVAPTPELEAPTPELGSPTPQPEDTPAASGPEEPTAESAAPAESTAPAEPIAAEPTPEQEEPAPSADDSSTPAVDAVNESAEEAGKDNATEEEPAKKLGGTLKLNTPIKEAMEEEVYYGTEGNVIDPVQIWGEADLLKSPRFKEAIHNKGFLVTDLQPKPFEAFKGPCNAPITKEQQKMRMEHFENRRVAKVVGVLQARAILVAQDEAGLRKKGGGDEKPALSTMILLERERVAKARKRMLDRNSQLTEHQDKLAKVKEEKQALIAAAEAREKAEKEAAAREAQKAELERAARAAQYKAEQQANYEKYFQQVQERQEEIKKKEKEREDEMVRRTEEYSAKMKIKQAATQKRIDDCLEQDKRNIADKRDRYEQKKKFQALRQAEKDELHRIELLKKEAELQERKRKVEAARLREKEIEEKRIQDFNDRKAAYEQRMEIKQLEDEKEAELLQEAQAKKHHIQLETRLEADRRREQIRENRIQRAKEKTERFYEYQDEVAHERLLHKEFRYLKQTDKDDFRQQFNRINEHERALAQQRIEEDTEKYRARLADQEMLLKERGANRKQTLIEKVTFFSASPGPGEYDCKDDSCEPLGGGFGLRPNPPEERDNPGPAAYVPNMESVLHKAGRVKFSTNRNKTALDFYIENFGKTPAPNEYDIDRDLKAPCMVFPEGDVPSDIERMCRVAAKLPAPHDYGNAWADVVVPMDCGTTFSKAPLPDPRDTPQKLNPSPAEYSVNLNSVRPKIKSSSLASAGDKSYLEGLQQSTSKVPGPGQYKVQMSCEKAALPIDTHPYGSDGVSSQDRAATTKLLHMRLRQSQSPVALAPHTAIDCSPLIPPRATSARTMR